MKLSTVVVETKQYTGSSKFCMTKTLLYLTNINELVYHSEVTVDKKVIQSLIQTQPGTTMCQRRKQLHMNMYMYVSVRAHTHTQTQSPSLPLYTSYYTSNTQTILPLTATLCSSRNLSLTIFSNLYKANAAC